MLKKIRFGSLFHLRAKPKPVAEQFHYQFTSGHLIILFISLLSLYSFPSSGQSIIRSSLSSLGTAVSEEGFILRQTIGQPSNTLIFANGEVTIRQGFQQAISGENLYKANNSLDFRLYPNPARDRTRLDFSEEMKDYTITIYNLTGTPLQSLPGQSRQSQWLDLKSYPEGMYIIKITAGQRTGSKKLILNH